MKNEKTYVIKKHWFFWVVPSLLSILSIMTLICPVIIMLWAYLRWKFDSIEIKEGNICSRLGVIKIDKKTIPLEKISMITEGTNIIGQLLHFGSIEIQSSASNNAIIYPLIDNPGECVRIVNELKNK